MYRCFSVCLSVHCMFVWCLGRPETSTGSLETKVIDSYELPCGYRDLNSGCLKSRRALSYWAIFLAPLSTFLDYFSSSLANQLAPGILYLHLLSCGIIGRPPGIDVDAGDSNSCVANVLSRAIAPAIIITTFSNGEAITCLVLNGCLYHRFQRQKLSDRNSLNFPLLSRVPCRHPRLSPAIF